MKQKRVPFKKTIANKFNVNKVNRIFLDYKPKWKLWGPTQYLI